MGFFDPWNSKSAAEFIPFGKSGNSSLRRISDPMNFTGINDDTSWRDDMNYYRNLMERPADISYQSAYDPEKMSLLPFAKTDPRAMNQFREEALRQGPSAWLNQANDRQSLLDLTSRERARKEGAGQAAEGASRLAMSGGLSSGARERLQKEAARNAMMRSQEIGRQGDLNRMQSGIQDEQNRVGMLGQVVGMQNQAIEPELRARQFDVGQNVAEGVRKNDFNMDQYKQKMQQWGALQQAGAIAKSGKKGSLLGMGENGGKK